MTNENTLEKSTPRALRRSALDTVWYAVLAVFFFLLPLQTRWILRDEPLYEWGTLSIYVVEVLGWVVIAFGLLRIRNEKLKMQNVKWLRWLGGLVVFAFVTVIWAPDKAVALQAAVRLFEGMLIFFITSYTLQATRYKIVWAFLTGAVLQAGLGIYQFLTQSTFVSTWLGMALHDPQALGTAVVEFGDDLPAQAGRWLRAYGGLPHPNVLGGYLVVALAILLCGNIKIREYKNILRYGVGAILLTGIFFSFSRSAWLTAGIVIVYFYARMFRQNPPSKDQTQSRNQENAQSRTIVRLCALLIIGYVVLLSVSYWPLVRVRIMPQNQERLEVRSRTERAEGVREAWALIKEHPVFGVGIGNYTQAVARELRPGQPFYTYQPVHSVPLLVLGELGIVGLLLLALVLSKIAQQSEFYILHSTFLILLVFDHYLWTLPFGILLFFAVLGLINAIHRPRS